MQFFTWAGVLLLSVLFAAGLWVVLKLRRVMPPVSSGRAEGAVRALAEPYRLVESRHGWMLANEHDAYLGLALITYGECCDIEVSFLLGVLEQCPGDVVEVGANVGTHTVPMAKLLAARGDRLWAFEPQPFIFQNLCANLALNGLVNVRATPEAVGATVTTVQFEEPAYASPGNFGGVRMWADPVGKPGFTPVRCGTLDTMVGVEHVGLIKVDVEGFELAVLQGGERTIQEQRPVLYVENDRVEGSVALIEWLWAHDYRLWWHTPMLFNPANFFGVDKNLYPQVASINMLCVPRGRSLELPQAGLIEVTSSVHPLASVADASAGATKGR